MHSHPRSGQYRVQPGLTWCHDGCRRPVPASPRRPLPSAHPRRRSVLRARADVTAEFDGLYDDPDAEATTGELELEERHALRRVAGLSTELSDVTEVEYRPLRLER